METRRMGNGQMGTMDNRGTPLNLREMRRTMGIWAQRAAAEHGGTPRHLPEPTGNQKKGFPP